MKIGTPGYYFDTKHQGFVWEIMKSSDSLKYLMPGLNIIIRTYIDAEDKQKALKKFYSANDFIKPKFKNPDLLVRLWDINE